MNQCEVCQKQAEHKCGGCHGVYYCGRQHQKEAWRKHKKVCRPFKVCEDATLGRYLVATKSIKPGDVVFQEPPLIWGPSPATIPICLGCCKGVDETTARPCTKCGWPVCGDLCEKSPGHLPECRYTTQRGERVTVKHFGIVHPIYQCVTVLRCLYQKQFLPREWKKLASLESHCEARKGTSRYDLERVTVAEFIRRFFKLGATFTEEEIMRVCGIVMVNCHEVPLTDPPHIAIYAIASLFEHHCSANCTKSFTNEGHILISAAKPIDVGDHLSICYTDPLWGTPNRRHFLHETKFFWCRCSRCQDPTEFGTNFSAVKCQNSSCTGYLLPDSFLDTQKKPPDWVCTKCSRPTSSYSVHDILERIGRDLSELDKTDPEACKKFITTYEGYLPDNHFYMTDVKSRLCQILGHKSGLAALSEEDLFLKAKLCTSVATLVKILAPAEKRTLGLVLFELHAATAEIARRGAGGNPEGTRHALIDSRNILVEAADCLKNEPDGLPEGKIFLQAKQNLKDIDAVLRAVHGSVGDSPI